MEITVDQLAQAFKASYDAASLPGVDPASARATIAQAQAIAIAAFVVGRTTDVTGVTVSGVALTGTGIILAD